jgi:trimeric autotransporter adhesin
MDAAFAVFKKTAIVLSLALLAAMPRLAQAGVPAFTSPANGASLGLSSNGNGSVTVDGSEDLNTPATPIKFSVVVTYQNGDRPWLYIGSDNSGVCTGGTNQYDTPIILTMGLGCFTPSAGTHVATVLLTVVSPSGVSNVSFTVTFTTGGSSGPSLVPTPSSLTGTNSLSAAVGAEVSTTVTLQTTSSSAVGFTTSTGASWLTAQANTNQATSTAPATLTITASAAGLSAAQSPYNSSVTVNYGTNLSLTINVTFNVTATGVSFTPSSVAWTYSSGALSPTTAQSVTLSTPNGDNYSAAISYTSSTAINWLQVNNSTSVTGLINGNSLSISVVNYTTLPVGSYTGTITVTDTGNSSNIGSLIVNLTVSGTTSGGLTITPSPISLSSTNTYEQLVTVTSTAGGAFTATPSSNWLSVTLSQNSIVAGGSAYLTVTANTTVSGSGTFTGALTIQVGSASQQVTVNLTSGSGAGGGSSGFVAPTALNFVAQSGGSDVTQQVVFVGSGTFTISNSPIYSTNSGSNAWFAEAEFTGSMTAQGTPVVLYANPRNLTPGTYTATVALSLVVNGVPDQNPPSLQVTFVVTSGEVLSASPSTVILNGGGTSQNASFLVSATGGSTALPVNVAVDQSWLTATIQNGVTDTPATVNVTANSSALANGLYSGNVIVTGGSEQPLYVPVVLVVTGVTNTSGLTLSAPSMTFAAQVGGTPPATQTLTVSSSPAGTPFSAAYSVTSPAGGTWLSITPSGNLSTNQGLTVSVNQSGLAAGSYAGTIVLTANSTAVTVPVNLVVNTTGTTGGNVTVSATTLDFSAVSGGATPATQSLTVSSAAGSSSVPFSVTTSSTGNWLSVSPTSGATQANLTVSVNQANLSGGTYGGSITISPTGGSTVVVQVTLSVVSQPAISVSPGSLSFAFQAGSGGTVAPGQLTVSATGGTASFQASASSTGNWLSVTPASGSTSTSATLTVQVNPAGLAAQATPYTGTITITGVSGTEGSLTVDVSLTVSAPLPSIAAVLNAASYSSGPVSPGEIVSIFGTSIGPTNPSFLTLDSTGKVSTSIGGVTVSFSGYPAPLTYVSATQINAIVPYGLSGNKEPFVEVKFAGQTSNDPGLTLATSAPGIFTQNSSGTGPGAILNGDSTLNTQQNPALAGSTIQIFGTGEGLTNPAQATGVVTPENLSGVGPLTPVPQLVVSVMIGNQPAQTAFVGEAPFLVAGVLQVDAVVPPTATSGANPITVQVGKQISQSGVTVWVK